MLVITDVVETAKSQCEHGEVISYKMFALVPLWCPEMCALSWDCRHVNKERRLIWIVLGKVCVRACVRACVSACVRE